MTRPLAILIGLTLVAANLSKWFLDLRVGGIDVRVGYFIPFTLVLLGVALARVARGGAQMPPAMRTLLLWKALFIASAFLTLPAMLAEGRVGMLVFTKAVGSELLIAGGVAAIMLIACGFSTSDRRRFLQVYLAAVAVAALYTVLQGVAAYGFNLDLDGAIAARLPFWNTPAPPLMDDRIWGIDGRTLYKFNGLTGDPNINATIFLVALPVMYLVLHERAQVWVAGLLALSLALIVQSVSNTVVPLTALLLVTLSVVYWRTARTQVVLVLSCVAVCLGGLLLFERAALVGVVQNKLGLADDGSLVNHARIAVESMQLWAAHPWGVGPNGFAVYSAAQNAHNSYLHLLAEYGPAGLVATLGSLWCLVRGGLRSRSALGTTAALSTMAIAAAALGHNVFQRIEFQLVIYSLTALAILEARDAVASRAVHTVSTADHLRHAAPDLGHGAA